MSQLHHHRDTVYFVCSGNTCRSPMAERLLKHALLAQPEPLRSLRVASLGTSAYPGFEASINSIHALAKVGIDLSDHRSTAVESLEADRALAYFCMTQSHRQVLMMMDSVEADRVFLVREWLGDGSSDIPDPFGRDVRAYLACRDAIVEAIPSIIECLRKWVHAPSDGGLPPERDADA